MAGTVKTPLNKRQVKKLGLSPNRKNMVSVICRARPVKDDPYNIGHPLAGRIIEFRDDEARGHHYAKSKDFPLIW